ncbi:AgmX/PglI C-terminal domain-containing protein [Sandaracinus amylolyticus]|nr:AgmX/PglI C-terminal domain-containing protein [Sandaracinus amylolyticus]
MGEREHSPKIGALLALQERRLSAAGRARIERHLAGCDVCRQALAAMALYDRIADEARDEAPPELDWSRMELALEREVEKIAEAQCATSPEGATRSSSAPGRTAAPSAPMRGLSARSSPAARRAAWGVAALAAAGVLAYVATRPPSAPEIARPTPPAPMIEAPAPEPVDPEVIAEAAPLAATVTLVAGRGAEVVAADGTTRAAAVDDVLADATTLRTDDASEVHVRLAEDTGVIAYPASEALLTRLRERDVEIDLRAGTLAASTGGPLFEGESRFVVIASEHRFELRVTRAEVVLDEGGVVRLAVAEGEVEVHRPDGRVEIVRAPARWSSAEVGEVPRVREPHGIADADAGTGVLHVRHPGLVRWQIGDVEAQGAGELAMRVRPGELNIGGFDSTGRAFRTVVVVGEDGVALDATDLQPQAPRVREGTLPEAEIRQTVQRGLPRLRQCYELGMRERPDLEGRLTVRITVGLDGSVSRAEVVGGDVPEGLQQCVRNYAERWTFPPPSGGFVRFDVPLAFGGR